MIRELLSENSGLSTARVISFMAFFAAIIIAFYGLANGKDPSALAVLCGAFIGPAIAGKTIQKFAEVKKDQESGDWK